MNASILMIILFMLLINSFCEARGGGGGRGGHGRSRGRSHSRGMSSSTISVNHRAWHYGSGSKIKSSTSLWNKPLDRPDIPSIVSRRYGNSFGSNGLGQNTFLSNNFFSRSHRESNLLTNVLFYHLGTRIARRNWSFDDDRRWRATTQSPYFANKVPGTDEILPAAAVVGAATAFGLATLLPLNVPASKPLMYCNQSELRQAQIQFKGNIYSCVNGTFTISCPRQIGVNLVDNCANNKTLECDAEPSRKYLSCSEGVLSTKLDLFCNSTIPRFLMKLNETRTVLLCYIGSYPKNLASFIPTTTEAPATTTETSFDTKVWSFFSDLFGTSDDDNKSSNSSWVPEALTLPPNFDVPEPEYPFSLEYQVVRNVNGRNVVVKQHPVEESVEKDWLKLHIEYGVALPSFVAKVPKRKGYSSLDSDEGSFEIYDSLEDDSTTTEKSLITSD